MLGIKLKFFYDRRDSNFLFDILEEHSVYVRSGTRYELKAMRD